jgi:hypothetical protein
MAQNDLDYYGARTDVNGPSMTDAIAAIAGAKLGSPGCAVYSSLVNSVNPFLTAPFHQWYESRVGGAFTFTTGEGGYLQEFLYGFTGLRWAADAVTVDPFLPPQLPGVDVTGIKWHGSTLNISVGQSGTRVTLASGPAVPVRDRNGTVRSVTAAAPLQLPTRHPAATPQPSGCAGQITSVAQSTRCVDVRGGNTSDSTPLDLYDCGSSAAQSWIRPGDGTVRALGKCMDVKGGVSTDGTAVQLYTCNRTASQQWAFDQPTGQLRAFGMCLDTAGGSTANDTALVITTCTGVASQKWHLPA